MRRVKAACIEQILKFQIDTERDMEREKEKVREEVRLYRTRMDRTGIRYKILEEKTLPDGSIQLHVKKQYNFYPTGTFLD